MAKLSCKRIKLIRHFLLPSRVLHDTIQLVSNRHVQLVFCSSTSVVTGANKLVVDNWLDTSLSACNVVAHSVKASLGRVDLDDALEGLFTSGKFVFVEFALGLAFFKK